MKTYILTFLFLSATFILNAQQFEWAKSFGGRLLDRAYSITTDASGNVYTVGNFQVNADFDPGLGIVNLASNGSSDVFIQKMDASGNFLWAKSFGGASGDYAQSITTDASGNVYTAGRFYGTVDFDPGVGIFNLTSNGQNSDAFIQKMDSSGNFLWVKSFGGTNSNDYAYSITTDASGNVYTAGSVGSAAFIQKMDASGNFLWAKSFGGINFVEAYSITTDASGNVYTAGYFQGTVDFDPGVGIVNLTSNGQNSAAFIQKMDASGNFLWAKSFGGLFRDEAYSITTDASGNVYTAGRFQLTVDFDPGVGLVNLTSNGSFDVFIQKMDASGNFLWAKSFGGAYSDEAYSITTDASGNLYTAGQFEGTVDFDPGLGIVNLTSNGGHDVFIQKMDASGNFLWAKSFGGTNADYAYSITTDASGNVYTAGLFFGTGEFDPGLGIVNLASNGSSDVFIQKMSQNGTLSLIIQIDNSLINLYPNPTSDFVTINLANKSKGQVIVSDLLGKVVLNKEFNSNQIQLSLKSIESKGTYLVKIIDSNGNVIANKKLIYQ